MNFKTTNILIVLLILVGGLVWWSQRGATPPEQTVEQPAGTQGRKIFSNLTAGHVTRLSITDAAGKRTNVERTGGQWRMTSPISAPAVDFFTRDLIGQLVDLRSHGTPSSDPGKDAGLDSPRYHIELATDDGKTININIGNKTGIGDNMYAKIDSGEIDLIDSALDKTLKSAPDEMRDKKLLTLSSMDIKQFRITYDGKSIAGAQVAGKWHIVDPVQIPGDDQAISSMLSTITGISASEFVKADAPDLALARFNRPTAQVWLSSDAPTTQPSTTVPSNPTGGVTLVIGGPDGLSKEHYFVKLSDGQAAKIAATSLDGFKRTPLDLRDKNVTSIVAADVTKVSIVKEIYPPPATRPATTQVASTQTATTQTTVAQTAFAVEPTPTPKPISTQTILLSKRPAPKPAELGPAMPMPAATQASTNPSTMASTMASNLPATQPVEEPSVWQLDDDPKGQLDDSKVAALLGKFQPLHAEKYLEKAADAPLAKHYLITLTAEQAGGHGEVTYTLDVTKSMTDTANPVAIYNGMTFELPQAFLDAVDLDFHKSAKPPEMMQPAQGMPSFGQ